MTREDMIDYLVDSDFKYIMEGNGLELLNSYLEFGFKGYYNYTDEELVAEVAERKAIEEMA